MSDPFVTRLAALAPDVDVAASRELFESLRSGDGSADQQPANRRWLLAAACLLLLVAGAVGVWAVAGRDDDRVPGTPPADDTTDAAETAQATTGDGTEFRLIAMEAVGDFDRRAIHVADTRDELDALLAGFRDSFDRYAADVAFQQSAEIAVVIERPDNACPLEIERFVPIEFDSTWRVEWADKSDEPCEDIGLGWVYLVAIPRTALTGVDRIVLPAEPDGSGFELGATVGDPAIGPTTVGFREGGIDGRVPAHDIAAYVDQAAWDEYAATELAGYEGVLIDLARYVVVVVRRADDDAICSGVFDRFEVDGSVWTPVFAPVDGGCDDEGPLTTTYVIGVARTALPERVTFALPTDADLGLEAVSVTVALGAEANSPGASSGSVVERPPVPGPQELESRLARFPFPYEGNPDDLASLIAAHDRGEDWTGTVSGVLFNEVRAGEWWLCFEILESFPVQCGTGFRLLDAPALYVEDPELFDEQRSEGASRASVVISRGSHPVVGTWFDDAAIFVETPSGTATSGGFELLATVGSTARPGTVMAATSPASLQAIWDQAGIADAVRADVDFADDVVLVFTVDDETCRAEFDGFTRGPGHPYPTWLVRFGGPDGTCAESATPTYVVSVERSAIQGGVVVALPSTKGYGPDDARVEFDPTFSIVAARWSCGETDLPLFGATLDLPAAVDVRIEVRDGDDVTGWGMLGNGGDAGTVGLDFGMTGSPSTTSVMVVIDLATSREVARMPLGHLPLPTCG